MAETWTIAKLLNWTTDYFKKYNIEWPHLEAEILLAHALNLKRIELYVRHEKVLTQVELTKFKNLIKRRNLHEPIAYITGNQPFMSLNFIVNPSVLIPRPETEEMVQLTIELAKRSMVHSPLSIVDIGAGCGNIAVSLAKFLPEAKIIGIDSSSKALEVAKQNAELNKVANRCQFLLGNLFDPLKNVAANFSSPNKIDIIVSNPPYIPTAEIDKLGADVKDFEPVEALDGGKDGLDYIRQLILEGPQHLKDKGYLILEFGFGQAEKIKELANNKFSGIEIKKDNSGKERFLLARK